MGFDQTNEDGTAGLTKDFIVTACEQRSARLEVAPFGLAIYLLANHSNEMIYANGRYQSALTHITSDLSRKSVFYLVDNNVDAISHRQLDIFLTDTDAFRLRLEISHNEDTSATQWSLVYMRKILIQGTYLLIVSLREGKQYYRKYAEHLGPSAHHNDLMNEESFRGFVESIRGFLMSDYMLSVIRRPC